MKSKTKSTLTGSCPSESNYYGLHSRLITSVSPPEGLHFTCAGTKEEQKALTEKQVRSKMGILSELNDQTVLQAKFRLV